MSPRPLALAALLFALWLSAGCARHVTRVPPQETVPEGLAQARQLVLVVTPSWDAPAGTLRAYYRGMAGADWGQALPEIPVNVGRSGLAWGRGLSGGPRGDGPAKREGDGRAPAGIFALPGAFAEPGAPGSRAFSVRPSSPSLVCVDDVASAHYNRVVDAAATPRDWNSAEEMQRPDGLYRQVVLVDHNVSPTTPGAGSCIFLHIWRGPDRPTAGCTSMDPAALEALVAWLDAGAAPVLVQLPEVDYQRLREVWRLP